MTGPAAAWPRISIVVPSYNQGAYLAETLESLFGQGYENLEVIVMDGGSTDDSVEVIRPFEDRLSYWVSEPDGGQTDALRRGFERATGEILGWLCSDDLLKPGTLRLAASVFSLPDAPDLVYGDTEYLYPDGTVVPKPRIGYDYEAMVRSFNFVPQPSAFWTRHIYDKAGGLDPSIQYAMDYDLFIRFGRDAKVVFIPLTLSTYRLHPNSKTASEENKFHVDFVRVREKALGHKLNAWDAVLRYYHLAKVVIRYALERRIWKLHYDRNKYKIASPDIKTVEAVHPTTGSGPKA